MERAIPVLGMGFAGSLVAYKLAQHGWNVTVVDPHAGDRLRKAAPRQATSGIGRTA